MRRVNHSHCRWLLAGLALALLFPTSGCVGFASQLMYIAKGNKVPMAGSYRGNRVSTGSSYRQVVPPPPPPPAGTPPPPPSARQG